MRITSLRVALDHHDNLKAALYLQAADTGAALGFDPADRSTQALEAELIQRSGDLATEWAKQAMALGLSTCRTRYTNALPPGHR